jgi:methyl-accepting chemotaxis protein
MTQQNAALVEQSTAASESLREQALQLTRAVSQFKLRASR